MVVTKSLCGYVSNQVQYNMESAQFHCLNCLMIVVLQKKLRETQSRSLNSMN